MIRDRSAVGFKDSQQLYQTRVRFFLEGSIVQTNKIVANPDLCTTDQKED